jgi:2-iminoacetate synthase
LKRFGKTIQLYIPLYLSNYCTNQCVYCGFNIKNKFERKILTEKEICKELEIIRSYGYEHILFVTGESPKSGIHYLKKAMQLVNSYFSLISIEVQPLEEDEYKQLIKHGLNTVYLYQETYNEKAYPLYHPGGKKADYAYRLDTYERMGRAGIHKMGLGVLLGLENWRTDSFFTALHLQYLRKKYWKTKYSVSLPRLRPNMGGFEPQNPISDKQLLQLICAYRLFDEDVEISMSTRESPVFRDNVIKLGVTSMSAGSSTEPGGYYNQQGNLKQFEVHDTRSPKEVEEIIRTQGYEAVWKDWDYYLQ